MRSTRPTKWVLPLALASALAMTACSNSSSDDSSSSSNSGGLAGSGSGETYKIAFEGPLSGDNQQLGINEVNAAQLAVDQANASGDLGFTLELLKADDQGDPAVAPTAAATVLQDAAVLGVVGPSFSGATKAVATNYGTANMAMTAAKALPSTAVSKVTGMNMGQLSRGRPATLTGKSTTAEYHCRKKPPAPPMRPPASVSSATRFLVKPIASSSPSTGKGA